MALLWGTIFGFVARRYLWDRGSGLHSWSSFDRDPAPHSGTRSPQWGLHGPSLQFHGLGSNLWFWLRLPWGSHTLWHGSKNGWHPTAHSLHVLRGGQR